MWLFLIHSWSIPDHLLVCLFLVCMSLLSTYF
jgi:hypothetical protein